jgi:type I restriction enzyme S subunit
VSFREFKPYTKYKESGIEWLREGPEHWGKSRLRWLSQIYSGGTPDKMNQDYWTAGTIPWLNSGTVNQCMITEPSDFITQEAYENSSTKWIKPGSLVIALAGQGKTKGMVAQLAIEATCNQSMAAIVPENEITPRFLFWWLSSNYQNIRNLSGGDLRDGLNLDLIGDIQCPLPEIQEQTIIAAFLDRETTRIESLISEKERLISLLLEYRQALISHAVTKGLDPNVKMKDSGVEWLGEVPEHWEIERTKWLFTERDDRTDSGNEELLTVSHLTGVTSRAEKDVNMFMAESLEGYKRCQTGDLVINTLWAWMGAMGITRKDGIVSPAYNVYEPNSTIDPEYIDFLVRIPSFVEELTRYSKGVWLSRLRLYPEGLYQVWLPVPPIEEQISIASFLDRETTKIGSLIDKAHRAIKLLQEYRSSLISAAVTGKIDVRESMRPESMETGNRP